MNLRLGGETDPAVLAVEDRVVLAHEHIAKDPERASRRRDVKTLGREEAEGAVRNNVIGEREGVCLAVDDEVHVRSISIAVDEVLASDERAGAEGLGEGRDVGGRAGEERGARVDDGGGAVGHRHTLDLHVAELDLPVRLLLERHPRNVTGELGLVHAANKELAVLVSVEREREHARVDLAVLAERAKEGRDAVDRDRVEGKALNAVEVASREGGAEARHVVHLSELEVSNREARHRDGVHGVVARNRAAVILC
mmetsp:Transcript_27186/g.73420  ORF Transcript_27186/g.73420 Transcript_27186/m.73420 type:complete len:254 (+) Transcript_27186:257-1018(+)